MKTVFGMAAVLAVAGMSIVATMAVADARGGIRGASGPRIMTGPRITTPQNTTIRPQRVPSQLPQRQVRGPRESGKGVNCRFVETSRRPIVHINPRTGASETTYISTGNTRCPLRI